MRDEYDFSKMNARPNPYAKMIKKQITININIDSIDYFKKESERTGIPYQTLINLYLTWCAENKKRLNISWKSDSVTDPDSVAEESSTYK